MISEAKFKNNPNLERELNKYLTRINLFSAAVWEKQEARVYITSTVMSKDEAGESAKKAGVGVDDFISIVIWHSSDALIT
jgi:hypothetical protein